MILNFNTFTEKNVIIMGAVNVITRRGKKAYCMLGTVRFDVIVVNHISAKPG